MLPSQDQCGGHRRRKAGEKHLDEESVIFSQGLRTTYIDRYTKQSKRPIFSCLVLFASFRVCTVHFRKRYRDCSKGGDLDSIHHFPVETRPAKSPRRSSVRMLSRYARPPSFPIPLHIRPRRTYIKHHPYVSAHPRSFPNSLPSRKETSHFSTAPFRLRKKPLLPPRRRLMHINLVTARPQRCLAGESAQWSFNPPRRQGYARRKPSN